MSTAHSCTLPRTMIEIGALLAAMPDAMLVTDRGARIVFASDQVLAVFGYAAAELIGRPVEMLLPERVRLIHAGHYARYFAAPSVRRMGSGLTFFGRRKDGSEFPIDIALSPATIGGEQRVICSVRDMTEQRIAAESLRRAAREWEARSRAAVETLRLFVEWAPAAVAMLDRDLRYLVVSRRWLEDYGLLGRELIGLHHYEVFPEIPDRWREIHRRALAGEPAQADEDSFPRQDGTNEWLRWDVRPWRAADGAIGGIMLFTEVITRRVVAEQALRRSHEQLEERIRLRTQELEQARAAAVGANLLKSRFLSAASHDLRQPLQAAGLCLSNLLLQLSSAPLRAACEEARASLERMAEILDALLDISRLESGAIEPKVADFELGPMLERIAGQHRCQAAAKGLRLVVEACEDVARTDAALLGRIIDNLLSNAIRYTVAGEVRVQRERDADDLRISVVDTGAGIPPEKHGTIFEEYVQLDNPARDRDKGLGLGLSIVKHIGHILGLRIELESLPGHGSKFTVHVPPGAREGVAKTPQQPEPQIRATPRDMAASPSVLLVEDNRAIAVALQMFLELRGYQSHLAQDCAGALALIDAGLRPDLIISDYRLPTQDGVWLLQQLRAKLGAVPAILMTGETAVRAEPGAEHYLLLHKPVNPNELARVVRALLSA